MFNPAVRIDSPADGGYDIWVGSYSEGESVRGTLYITDDPAICPAS